MAINFWAMQKLVTRLTQKGANQGAYAGLLGFKFVMVAAAMFLLVHVMALDPIGLIIGILTLFVGLGFAMIHKTSNIEHQPNAITNK